MVVTGMVRFGIAGMGGNAPKSGSLPTRILEEYR